MSPAGNPGAWQCGAALAGIHPFAFALAQTGLAIVPSLARARRQRWRHAAGARIVAAGTAVTRRKIWNL
jgi:hypothetical protein